MHICMSAHKLGGAEGEREKERSDSPLSAEPHTGLDLTTLRS